MTKVDGRYIRQLRAALHMSRAELAILVAVREYTVYRWEKGMSSPSWQAQARVVELMSRPRVRKLLLAKGVPVEVETAHVILYNDA